MKRKILLLSIAILVVIGVYGSRQTSKSTSSFNAVIFNAAQARKEQITTSLSPNALQYISDDLTVSDDKIVSDDKTDDEIELSVTARVILPQAIPLVASELCPATIEAIKDDEIFSSYKIRVCYYEESNSEGTNSESLVTWFTNDGNSGTFVDASKNLISSKTIDQLYEYYDNFGRKLSDD